MFDSGCGAVGSALVWGTRGHRFKSGHPDQNIDPENHVLIHGDCLTGLKEIEEESADLVYLDPPFFTQKRRSLKTRDNSKEYSFEDTWESIEEYIRYMEKRLEECRRILKSSGSVFLHCDRSASHHLRVALDDVFGDRNFRSEIVWAYRRWSNAKKGLLNRHQVIHFYSKTPYFKFNPVYESYSPTTNIDQIFQKRARNKHGRTTYKKTDDGNFELTEGKKGVPLSDVWEIPYLNPKARERAGYPSQKPVVLLERIIKLVTDEGDTVVDPFCGSGTTLVAAKLLKRKFAGIDISEDAIELTRRRLENPVKSESESPENGKGGYFNRDNRIMEILNEIEAVPVRRNRGIDGFLRIDGEMRPVPVRIQRTRETVEDAANRLLNASRRNGFATKILIRTDDGRSIPSTGSQDSAGERGVVIVEDLKDFQTDRKKYALRPSDSE